MKFKKIMLILSFLLCILLIGAVSAASDTNGIVEIDDSTNEIIEINENLDNEIAEESVSDEALSSDSDMNVLEDFDIGWDYPLIPAGTFLDLQTEINEENEINLGYDYSFDSSFDQDLKTGIVVNKNITINGNNYTIDGKGISRIFNVKDGATLTIKNLKLCNGSYLEGGGYIQNAGGAILLSNSNLVASGCTFNNNHPPVGGAIYASSSNLTLSDSTFTNNNVTGGGGAIFVTDSDLRIIGSTFTNNNGSYGGVIYSSGSTLNVYRSDFSNNTAGYSGGAIYLRDKSNAFVIDSTFCNNHPDPTPGFTSFKGGAIYANDSTLTVTNGTFKNNSAIVKEDYYSNGGAIYFGDGGNLHIADSVFSNNQAKDGSAIDARNGIVSNTKFVDGNTVIGGITVSDDCIYLITPIFTFGSISSVAYGSPITIVVAENHGLNGTVTVAIGSKKYSIAMSNGLGSKTVSPMLAPGKYKVILTFVEDDKFYSTRAESDEFTISKAKTNLVASNKVVNAPKYKTYKITLKNKAGKAIKSTTVSLKIGKYTVKAKTNSKGVATYKILYSKISSAERSTPYKVTAKIIKNANVKSLKDNKLSLNVDGKTYTLKSNKEGTAIFSAKKPASIRTYDVVLKDSNGKTISKASVSLKVNGKTYKAITNANGKATFKLNNLNKNSKFKVEISYAGNSLYNKCTKTTYITIKDR